MINKKSKTKSELLAELKVLRKHLAQLEKADRRKISHAERAGLSLRFSDLEKRLERLKPNDHLCLIYESPEEWRAAIIPFLTIGLKRGEKCIYIVGTHTASHIRNYLNKAGIDVADVEASGQFVILHKTDAYTREGLFDPDRMISLLIAESEKAIAEGYPGLRVTEEVSVRPRGYLGLERLLEYEAKLNRDFFPRYPCVAICQYDRWKSDPGIIKNAIMTHPLIVRNNQICQNFYYVSPEEFLMQKREEKEVQDWLSSIEQEGEARKRVRFLSDVLERSSQPFTVSYSDGHIMFCNPAFSALTGYTEEELHIMTWIMHLTPPEWRESEAKVLEELRRTGMPQRYEKECIRKDGSQIPIEVFIHQISDARGNVQYYYTFITDITERKRIEKVLIQKERLARERARLLIDLRNLDKIDDILRRVCEAVRDSGLFQRAVMTLHKPGGEIVHLGQVGLDPKVIERARKASPIDDELRARVTAKRFRISDSFFIPAEAGLNFKKSSRYVPQKEKKSGGDWQPGDELFVPLRDFSGKIMGYLSVDTPTDGCRPDLKTIEALEMLVEAAASRVREIEAQEVLRRERNFSQSILETANSLIVCLDADARITVFNEECERVTGYRSEEVIGKRWPELFLPPGHHATKLNSFAKWVRAHPYDRYEGPIVTKSGEIRTILWSNSAILGAEEKDVVAIAVGHDITERKLVEEELRRSEERYRDLVEKEADIIYTLDVQGNITSANAAVRNLSYQPEELIGKNFDSLISKEWLEKTLRDFQNLLRTGEIVAETVLIDKKGQPHFVEYSSSVIKKGNKVVGTRGVIRDMTERKRAEERLSKLNNCFLSLGPDARKNIEMIVQTAEEILGGVCMLYNRLEKERGILSTWAIWPEPEGYNPEDDPEGHICYDVIRQGKEGPVVMENLEGTKYEKTDPNVRKYSLKSYLGYPVRLKDEVVGSFCVCDVKKRKFTEEEIKIVSMLARAVATEEECKQAEDKLRENEEKFRSVVQSTNDAIISIDCSGNITLWNKGAETIFGYSVDEMIGKPLTFVMPERFRRNHRNAVKRLVSTGKSRIIGKTVRMFGLRKNGSEFPIEMTLSCCQTKEGVFFTSIIRDISDHKSM